MPPCKTCTQEIRQLRSHAWIHTASGFRECGDQYDANAEPIPDDSAPSEDEAPSPDEPSEQASELAELLMAEAKALLADERLALEFSDSFGVYNGNKLTLLVFKKGTSEHPDN